MRDPNVASCNSSMFVPSELGNLMTSTRNTGPQPLASVTGATKQDGDDHAERHEAEEDREADESEPAEVLERPAAAVVPDGGGVDVELGDDEVADGDDDGTPQRADGDDPLRRPPP